MKRGNSPSRGGITLVELLVVTAIMAVISLATYTTLSNGLKIWNRVNKQIPEEDLDIFFDKITHDLRNCIKFAGINFQGQKDRVEFASIVNSRPLKGETVGQVIYRYNPSGNILSRIGKDFTQLYTGEESETAFPLSNLQSVKFEYYFFDKETKEFLWQEEWMLEGVPAAIKIVLGFTQGKEVQNFTRTISIPIGS